MIHEAGELTHEGLQRCTRCGIILTDYRNTVVPEGTPPLRGWAEGAFINVFQDDAFRGLEVVEDLPNCVPIQ